MDLTPYYGYERRRAFPPRLPRHPQALWRRAVLPSKRWCDECFYLKHNEQRGVGGIFLTIFPLWALGCMYMTEAVGVLLQAYLPIVQQRAGIEFGQRERDFPALPRRGRYVEFNLV